MTTAAGPNAVVCPVCSFPNDAARKLCGRCGASLTVTAAAVVTLPWYRTIFRRNRSATAAGDRPGGLGREGQQGPSLVGRVIPLVIVAVFAFGLTSLAVIPGVRGAIGDVVTDLRLRFLPTIQDVHPSSADGAGVDGHPASLAVDTTTGTYWLAEPEGASMTARLPDETNLGGLVISSGSVGPDGVEGYRRPEVLELSFPNTDEPAVQVTLADTAEAQPLVLDVRGIDEVVVSVLRSFDGLPGAQPYVAIREIEFKERR